MRILVTGGAGFIGSNLVRLLLEQPDGHEVLTLDKLTYAGHLASLEHLPGPDRHRFVQGDIADAPLLEKLFSDFQPDAIFHLAAESHVDRSIDGAAPFIQTNIVGTFVLLERATFYWKALPQGRRETFRLVHVSTDEVFGALGVEGVFTEETPYRPNSPYAASKASADQLVRAWRQTYGLPVVTTNCCNNYGPYQFPEKLLPITILNAVRGQPLPVYGRGEQVRDWLYVRDHARALLRACEAGAPGESYLIGARTERRNIDLVETVCAALDDLAPRSDGQPHRTAITYVADRPGHDFRYAIDPSKAERDLGWSPEESFASGLHKTVSWYLQNAAWCETVMKEYRLERLGVGPKC